MVILTKEQDWVCLSRAFGRLKISKLTKSVTRARAFDDGDAFFRRKEEKEKNAFYRTHFLKKA